MPDNPGKRRSTPLTLGVAKKEREAGGPSLRFLQGWVLGLTSLTPRHPFRSASFTVALISGRPRPKMVLDEKLPRCYPPSCYLK
jgi:hypothetical protein